MFENRLCKYGCCAAPGDARSRSYLQDQYQGIQKLIELGEVVHIAPEVQRALSGILDGSIPGALV